MPSIVREASDRRLAAALAAEAEFATDDGVAALAEPPPLLEIPARQTTPTMHGLAPFLVPAVHM
ncbi:MAG: hypothetical protein R6X20_01225 [Phycisphaerae bacterium]